MSLDRVRPLDHNDLTIPGETDRPWYMLAGQLLPKYLTNRTTDIKIFPEDLPQHDRIPGKKKRIFIIYRQFKFGGGFVVFVKFKV